MAVIMPTLDQSPTFQAMAFPDDVDEFAIMCGQHGTGVISGCQVTQLATPGMAVQVAAGIVKIQGILYLYPGVASLSIAAASTGGRRDTIALRKANGVVTAVALEGTPAGVVSPAGPWTTAQNPTTNPPPLKVQVNWSSTTNSALFNVTTDCPLAEVDIEYNTTSILTGTPAGVTPTSGNIVDKSIHVYNDTPISQLTSAGQDATGHSGSATTPNILSAKQVVARVGAASIGTVASALTTLSLQPGPNPGPNPNGPVFGSATSGFVGVTTSTGEAFITFTGSEGNILTGLTIVGGGSGGTVLAGLVNFGSTSTLTQYQFPIYDMVWGDSIAEGVGSTIGGSGYGVSDWSSILCQMENEEAGLPAPNKGFVQPFGGPGSVYGQFEWSNTASATAVATGAIGPIGGGASPGSIGPATWAAKLTGTNSCGDVPAIAFRRVVVYWLAQPNGEKIAIATTGTVKSLAAIDTHIQTATVTLTATSNQITVSSGGFPGAAVGDIVTVYSGGGTIPAGTTVLQINGNTMTLSANVSGTGTATIAYQGFRSWDSFDLGSQTGTGFTVTCSAHSVGTGAAGLITTGAFYMNTAGTSGSLMMNVAVGGTQSGDWSPAATVPGNQFAWLQMLVNNGIPPRRLIVCLGGNDQPGFFDSSNTPTTMAANLAAIVQEVQAISSLIEIVLVAEYCAGSTTTGDVTVGADVWASQWVQAICQTAIANNCTFVDMFANSGNCTSNRPITDGTTTAGSNTLTSATASFTLADNGSYVGCLGVYPPGTTLVYVNSTTVTTSNESLISTTTGQMLIGGDPFSQTMDNGFHFNAVGQRTHAELFWRKLRYSQAQNAGASAAIGMPLIPTKVVSASHTYSIASATPAAIDTTNLTTGPFVATTTQVKVKLAAANVFNSTGTGIQVWLLMDHASPNAQRGYHVMVHNATTAAIENIAIPVYVEILVTGLTVGQSYQFDWAWGATAGTANITTGAVTSGNVTTSYFGAASIDVLSA